eukprot:3563788-Rhodomonas_salina.3
MMIVGHCFDLLLGGASTMMQLGVKFCMLRGQSLSASGQRLSMQGPMCVVTRGALWPFLLPLRAAEMPLISCFAIWFKLCMRGHNVHSVWDTSVVP